MDGSNDIRTLRLRLFLGDNARLWSDHDPYLYEAIIGLQRDSHTIDRQTRRFGLRSVRTEGQNILLNDEPVFLRGYVDCCIFPETGYPVWDINNYRRQFRIVKSFGFNHVRLHGWTSPKPFWQAADEAGMLVQTELPHWSQFYRKRSEMPESSVHAFLADELNVSSTHSTNIHHFTIDGANYSL